MLKNLFAVMIVAVATLTLQSCLDDDGYSVDNFAIGVVTVKPLSSDSYFLQLDDSTTLWPAAGYAPYFGLDQERRALVNFTFLGDSTQGDIKGYDYAVRINRIDSILTKSIAEDLGDKNNETYGIDPVWMKSIWIEDGYINFQFNTYFGGTEKHFINLVKMDNAASPYELEFRHNAFKDPSHAEGWGLAAFRLNTLPDTEGKTVKLKIKYNSFEGDKVYEINYKSGEPTGKAPAMSSENFHLVN